MGVERKWGRRGKMIRRLARRATPMKWTIRLELTPDGNPPITYDIGTVTRCEFSFIVSNFAFRMS